MSAPSNHPQPRAAKRKRTNTDATQTSFFLSPMSSIGSAPPLTAQDIIAATRWLRDLSTETNPGPPYNKLNAILNDLITTYNSIATQLPEDNSACRTLRTLLNRLGDEISDQAHAMDDVHDSIIALEDSLALQMGLYVLESHRDGLNRTVTRTLIPRTNNSHDTPVPLISRASWARSGGNTDRGDLNHNPILFEESDAEENYAAGLRRKGKSNKQTDQEDEDPSMSDSSEADSSVSEDSPPPPPPPEWKVTEVSKFHTPIPQTPHYQPGTYLPPYQQR